MLTCVNFFDTFVLTALHKGNSTSRHFFGRASHIHCNSQYVKALFWSRNSRVDGYWMTAWSNGVPQRCNAEGFQFEFRIDNIFTQQMRKISRFGSHSVSFSFATTPTRKAYSVRILMPLHLGWYWWPPHSLTYFIFAKRNLLRGYVFKISEYRMAKII